MSIYFNHSSFENGTMDKIPDYITEVMSIKKKAQGNNENLYFYQDFWDVKLDGTDLRNFMFKNNNLESVKGLIASVMNGPYYYNNFEKNHIETNPRVNSTSFGETLLGICFKDNQPNIVSLAEEKEIVSSRYEVKGYGEAEVDFEVINFMGEEGLESYVKRNMIFHSINDVFTAIEQTRKNIVILENAKKSAKKHDFRGSCREVYNAICSLEDVELPALLSGENDENRRSLYYSSCSIEISKESSETLNVERYRKEREFVIPGKGKMVFQWHIKIGGGHTRIYYFIDKEDEKIYIGHCGKHLGTSSYNS